VHAAGIGREAARTFTPSSNRAGLTTRLSGWRLEAAA